MMDIRFRKNDVWWAAIGIGVLVLGGGIGCRHEADDPPAYPVETKILEPYPFERRRVYPGRTVSARRAVLSFRVPGKLHMFDVNLGDSFETGALIGQLDLRDFQASVHQAEGVLEQAEASLDLLESGAREEDVAALEAQLKGAGTAMEEADFQYQQHQALFEEALIPKGDLASIRTRYAETESRVATLEQELKKARAGGREEKIRSAKGRVRALKQKRNLARSALDDASLRAPFQGTVTATYVENHQVVKAGMPIVELQDTDMLEVTVGIPEQLRHQLDDVIDIRCRLEEFKDAEVTAQMVELGADASPRTRTYPLTLRLEIPPDLRALPGMTAEVEIRIREESEDPRDAAFAVPPPAVVSKGNDASFVWVVHEEKETWRVRRRQVTVLDVTNRKLIIRGEVERGNRIVTAGAGYLSDGQRVARYPGNR